LKKLLKEENKKPIPKKKNRINLMISIINPMKTRIIPEK